MGIKLTPETLDRFAQHLAEHFVTLLMGERESLPVTVPTVEATVEAASKGKRVLVTVPTAKPIVASLTLVSKKPPLVSSPAKSTSTKPPSPPKPNPLKPNGVAAKPVPLSHLSLHQKKQAIQAIVGGETTENVARRFTISVASARALKAHATRGTYD